MEKEITLKKGLVPDLKGYGLKDALYALETLGMRCQYEGSGHVVSQSPAPGTKAKADQTVKLILK